MAAAWIEFMSEGRCGRHELQAHELPQIGAFTRENVVTWMDSHTEATWVGITPVMDIHAVCGEIDIPWATEEARLMWAKLFDKVTPES